MIPSPLVRAGVAVSAVVALVASGPAISQALGLDDASASAMPDSWESAKQLDATSATPSHQAALAAEKERRKAERKARERARQKARERAARARAAHGGTPAQNQALGMQMCREQGWSAGQCADLGRLWQKESGWNSRAHNSSSGAHGIPQALPGSKMSSHGSDWATNPRTQIAWGLDYIRSRYGNPSAAWSHSQRVGWY